MILYQPPGQHENHPFVPLERIPFRPKVFKSLWRAQLAGCGETAGILSEHAVFNGRLKLKPLESPPSNVLFLPPRGIKREIGASALPEDSAVNFVFLAEHRTPNRSPGLLIGQLR